VAERLTGAIVAVTVPADVHRQLLFVRVSVVVHSQRDVLQVVGALHPPSRFTRGLNRWQQQRYQDADDGDDDKQFHQRETLSPTRT
jgi:hypothetical protein